MISCFWEIEDNNITHIVHRKINVCIEKHKHDIKNASAVISCMMNFALHPIICFILEYSHGPTLIRLNLIVWYHNRSCDGIDF